MKRHIILALFTAITSIMAITANAQSNILSKKEISSSSITGTWIYGSTELIFESEDAAKKLSTSQVAIKGDTYLKKGLTKAGFTPGNATMTLNSNNTVSISIGNKSVDGTYSIEGSTITFTYNGALTGASKTMSSNISISGDKLTIAISAKQLLTLVHTISPNASSASTTLSTVSGLLSSVQGIYVGLQFEKK